MKKVRPIVTLPARLAPAAAAQKAEAGQAPIYFSSWDSGLVNDVSAILPVMFGAGAPYNYAKDAELEKLVAEGGATIDREARKAAYDKAIEIASAKAYWMPMNTYVNTYAFSKQIEFKTFADELPRFYLANWK